MHDGVLTAVEAPCPIGTEQLRSLKNFAPCMDDAATVLAGWQCPDTQANAAPGGGQRAFTHAAQSTCSLQQASHTLQVQVLAFSVDVCVFGEQTQG